MIYIPNHYTYQLPMYITPIHNKSAKWPPANWIRDQSNAGSSCRSLSIVAHARNLPLNARDPPMQICRTAVNNIPPDYSTYPIGSKLSIASNGTHSLTGRLTWGAAAAQNRTSVRPIAGRLWTCDRLWLIVFCTVSSINHFNRIQRFAFNKLRQLPTRVGNNKCQ